MRTSEGPPTNEHGGEVEKVRQVGKIVTRSVTVIGSMMAGFIGFLIYTTLTR
ncbi:MAG: hypothetical protein WBL06_02785 [Pseudolysinimonas sp.]|uniref:hypothetical protein n=1 Tax=Pseudolysinimonas sp. TaxID=2680009 RepID=UPI003C7375F9